MWIIEHFFLVAAIVVPVCASAAVTIHVLLTKQDVGPATTWIGLAWLAPYAGAVIYLLFGINRVARRARKLRRRTPHMTAADHSHGPVSDLPHLVALNVASLRVTGRRALGGNAISLLSQGDESYPAMLAAIEGAQTSLVLSSYIFRNDGIGKRFISSLADAVRRGVQVRVLIDGIGGGYIFSPAYRHLRAEGVPAARFMHSLYPWRMPFLNLRSHRKLLIADGRLAFTGGINIGDENVLATNPPHPVRDTHFAVSGPIVSELMTAFVEDWAFATGEWLNGPIWFAPIEEQGDTSARVITSGPDHDLEKVKQVILAAVASAKNSVRIATPYFLPDAPLVTTLALAAMRSVTVDIVIPGNSDHMLFDFACRAGLEPLIQAGCRVWHGIAPFDHSKLMTVDGSWSLIGSANWDMRSMRLNFELNVEAYDPQLASQLEERIASRHGYRVRMPDLNARSLPVKLRDATLRLLLPYL